MINHTKGPWIIDDGYSTQKDLIITTENRIKNSLIPIVEIDYLFNGKLVYEQNGNAKIISKSPEMYNLLCVIRDSNYEITSEVIDEIATLIDGIDND